MRFRQSLTRFVIYALSVVGMLSCTLENSDSELCEGGTVFYIDNAQTYILIPTTAPQYCAYVSKGGRGDYFVGRIGSGTIGPFTNIKKALQVAGIRNDKWLPISEDFQYDGLSLVNIHTGDSYKKLCSRADYNKDVRDKYQLTDFDNRHYNGIFGPKPTEIYSADIYLTNENGIIKGNMNLSGKNYLLNGNYIVKGLVDVKGSGKLEVYDKKNNLIVSLYGKFSEYSLYFKQAGEERNYFISATDPKYKKKYD